MNRGWVAIGLAAAAYVIGAIPFAYLIGRWRGVDIRRVGSGNVGATNVFRSVGRGWGIAAFILDAAKGCVPVAVLPHWAARAGWLDGVQAWPGMLCMAAAVAGHTWPVFLRFKGGKGVATSAGALLALAPLALGVALIGWVCVFMLTRIVSLASLAAAVLVPACAWIRQPNGARPALPAFLTILAVIVIWRHRANIVRILQGTEHRFGRGAGGKAMS